MYPILILAHMGSADCRRSSGHITKHKEDSFYAFTGFLPDSGDFYYEGGSDFWYWGYYHPGRGVKKGNVTDNIISLTDIRTYNSLGSISVPMDGIEYTCQTGYNEHSWNAALWNDGRYLTTVSALTGYRRVIDTRTMQDIVKLRYSPQDATPENGEYFGSVGVRAVYLPKIDNILVYDGNKALSQYALDGTKVAACSTAHYLYNMLLVGERLYLIEFEGEQWYLEVIDWDSRI